MGSDGYPIVLQPGDIFCVEKGFFPDSIIEQLISLFEERSIEALPRYVHSGIILNGRGKTLEALWHVRENNLASYEGQQIMIARVRGGLSQERFSSAFQRIVAEHYGERYPINRLFLHAAGLAKVIHFQKVVCSELAAEFLKYALVGDGLFELDHYFGWTPADLAEIFYRWIGIFKIIYRGKWSNSLIASAHDGLLRGEKRCGRLDLN